MRVTRALAVVVLLYGFNYLIYGVSQLLGYFSPAFRRDGLPVIALNLMTWLTTSSIAVGLFCAKEWARRAWLAVALAMTLMHLLLLAAFHLAGRNLDVQALNVAQIVVLAPFSWLHLTRPSTRALFG